MTTVIFSDTHLTDTFNPQLYALLKQIIMQADRVVINGDFWDGYLTDFDAFVTSPWNTLFPLLKSKKTVYVYGNHDAEWMSDSRVALFSDVQTHFYQYRHGDALFTIQHGHLLFSSWVTTVSSYLPFFLAKLINQWLISHEQRQTLFGRLFQAIEQRFDVLGDAQVRFFLSTQKKGNDHWTVLGHTHIPRLEPQNRYLNPGRFTEKHPVFVRLRASDYSIQRLP